MIVIAHDAEIENSSEGAVSASRAAYERQKEKFIGKTLRVGSGPADILPSLTERMTNRVARECVERSTNIICEVFKASGERNLRSLRQAIEDFDQVIDALHQELKEYPDVVDSVSTHVLALEIEFRAGSDGLSFDDIRNLGQEAWTSIPFRTPSRPRNG